MNIFSKRKFFFHQLTFTSAFIASLFVAAEIYSDFAYAQTSLEQFKNSASTVNSGLRVKETVVTQSQLGVTYVKDDNPIVRILPEGKNLNKNPLQYHFELSETRPDGQGLTIYFPDHRERGFICAGENNVSLDTIIENLQKNFFDKLMHLNGDVLFKYTLRPNKDEYDQNWYAAAEAGLSGAMEVQHGSGVTSTAHKKLFCMSAKQSVNMSSRDRWYSVCDPLLTKFAQTYPKKINKLIKGLEEFGYIPPYWKFEGLETYIVKLNKGDTDKKIFPGKFSSMKETSFDTRMCYTGGEILDALKKYRDWEKQQLTLARKWMHDSYDGKIYKNPYNERTKKADEKFPDPF